MVDSLFQVDLHRPTLLLVSAFWKRQYEIRLDTMSKLTENWVSMFYAKLELAFVCSIDRIKWIVFSSSVDYRFYSSLVWRCTCLNASETICFNLIVLHLILFIRFKEREIEKMNVWCVQWSNNIWNHDLIFLLYLCDTKI